MSFSFSCLALRPRRSWGTALTVLPECQRHRWQIDTAWRVTMKFGLAILLVWIPSLSLAQSGICYVDGVAHTTLAQGITCAGSAGTIEVTPSVGVLSVPSNTTVQAGVTLRIDQGAVLSIASGQTLTISGPIVDGPYRMFSGPGSVRFTLTGNQAVSRPEWFGAVANGTTGPGAVTGTDNLAAFNAALAALPTMLFFDQGTKTLQNGSLGRTGKLLLSLGRYVVSDTLNWSPWVSYEWPSYNGCTIYLKDGVAASGPEKWVINLQSVLDSGGYPSPNTTYGGQFRNITVDCQGGKYYGTNSSSSGVVINGAQGTSLGNIWIGDCGLRGLWIANYLGNGSSVNGENIIEVLGVVVGPGVQIDAGACNIEIIRSEDVNCLRVQAEWSRGLCGPERFRCGCAREPIVQTGRLRFNDYSLRNTICPRSLSQGMSTVPST